MKAIALLLAGCIAGSMALLDDAPKSKKNSAARTAAESDNPLKPLGMMTGRWVRTQGKDWLEETWSAPQGDCMMGMFRWMKDGRLWMMELMTITVEDGRPVFYIRHFDRRAHAWEEKDAPLRYPLKTLNEHEAVFEDLEREFPQRFAFRRPDEGRFIVRFEGMKNGKRSGSQFDYTAADPADTVKNPALP